MEEVTQKNIGRLKMLSSTKDTFSKFHTEFQLQVNDDSFCINKPYMKRNYCEIMNDQGEKKGTHLRQNLLKLKRERKLEGLPHSTIESAVFILILSVVAFVA